MKRIKYYAIGAAAFIALTIGTVANADSLQEIFFMNLRNSSIILTCDQSDGFAQIKMESTQANTAKVSCLVEPTSDPESSEPVQVNQTKLYFPIASK